MPDEYRGAPEWSQPPGPRKTSGSAMLALGAGVASFLCLPGLGGVLAIALGWVAHSEIERSDGRLTGRGLASTGIGFGIANLVVAVVGVGVLVAFAVRADPAPVAVTPARPSLPAPVTPRRSLPPAVVPAPLPAPATPPSAETADTEPSIPSLPARVGQVTIIEATAGSGLESQLRAQLAASKASGEQVVLWTIMADCEPCDAVGRALPDARMQRALGHVRLVRAEIAPFKGELERMGVPIESAPGFTLLDSRARPLDHIHGGEWDADIPANIAPILDKFLKRTFQARRHPWSRPLRDGETTL